MDSSRNLTQSLLGILVLVLFATAGIAAIVRIHDRLLDSIACEPHDTSTPPFLIESEDGRAVVRLDELFITIPSAADRNATNLNAEPIRMTLEAGYTLVPGDTSDVYFVIPITALEFEKENTCAPDRLFTQSIHAHVYEQTDHTATYQNGLGDTVTLMATEDTLDVTVTSNVGGGIQHGVDTDLDGCFDTEEVVAPTDGSIMFPFNYQTILTAYLAAPIR